MGSRVLKREKKKGNDRERKKKKINRKRREIDRDSSQQPGRNLFWVLVRVAARFHSTIFSDWRILGAWRRSNAFHFFFPSLDRRCFLFPFDLDELDWLFIVFSFTALTEVSRSKSSASALSNNRTWTHYCGIRATSNAIWAPFSFRRRRKDNRSRWSLMRVSLCDVCVLVKPNPEKCHNPSWLNDKRNISRIVSLLVQTPPVSSRSVLLGRVSRDLMTTQENSQS